MKLDELAAKVNSNGNAFSEEDAKALYGLCFNGSNFDHEKEEHFLLDMVDNPSFTRKYYDWVKKYDDSQKTITKNKSLSLDRFHLRNGKGVATSVFHDRIFEDIKATVPMFCAGGVAYIYDGGVYRADISGAVLKSAIKKRIYPRFRKSTTINQIYNLFFMDHELERSLDDVNLHPTHWICFRNGYYDLVERKMIPHDPKFFTTNMIPYAYDFNPNEKLVGEHTDAYLASSIPDSNDREMILEFIAWSMTADVSFQKFMVLLGDGGSGKSVLIWLASEIVGSENTSNVPLEALSQRFASYGIVGKLLNCVADLEIEALKSTATIKQVTGEDSVRVEKKGCDAFSIRPIAKHLFSMNELPQVNGERSNGFFRRMLVLNMNHIPEQPDPQLKSKLKNEIPYLISLAVAAGERLYKRGRLLESSNSKRAVALSRAGSDTVEAFLQESGIERGSHKKERGALYNQYQRFCAEEERRSLTRNAFFKALRTKRFEERRLSDGRYFLINEGSNNQGEFMTIDNDSDIPF